MDAVSSVPFIRAVIAIAVAVSVASCVAPVKSKRQAAVRSDVPPLNSRREPSSITAIDTDDSSRSSPRRRILPLREQIDKVEGEHSRLLARIDSMDVRINQLKSSIDGRRGSDASSPVTAVVRGSEPIRTSMSPPAAGVRVNDDEDLIRPDEMEAEETVQPSIRKRPAVKRPVNIPSKRRVIARPTDAREVVLPQETGSGAVEKMSTDKAADKAPVTGDPARFTLAMDLFKRKQYKDCIVVLNALNTSSASSEGIARNNYWIGESNFGLARYEEAIRSFKKTLGYTSSEKAAAAQLMIAESYVRLGRNADAKKGYERVVKMYPQSAEAVRALKRLQQI